MPGFSTLTPYYSEEVILSLETLCSQTADGVTTLEYLQTLFPHQWTALVERMRREMPHVRGGTMHYYITMWQGVCISFCVLALPPAGRNVFIFLPIGSYHPSRPDSLHADGFHPISDRLPIMGFPSNEGCYVTVHTYPHLPLRTIEIRTYILQ